MKRHFALIRFSSTWSDIMVSGQLTKCVFHNMCSYSLWFKIPKVEKLSQESVHPIHLWLKCCDQRSFFHFWPTRKILNSWFVGFSPNDCSNTWEGESLWSDYMIYRRMPSCKPKPSRSLSEGGLRLGWKPLLTKGPYIPGSFSLYHQSHREETLPRFIEKKDVKWNQPALKQWKNRHILHCHQIEVVDGGVVTPYAFYIAAQVH